MAPRDSAKDYYSFQELSKATDFMLLQSAKDQKIEFDPCDKQNIHEAYAVFAGIVVLQQSLPQVGRFYEFFG